MKKWLCGYYYFFCLPLSHFQKGARWLEGTTCFYNLVFSVWSSEKVQLPSLRMWVSPGFLFSNIANSTVYPPDVPAFQCLGRNTLLSLQPTLASTDSYALEALFQCLLPPTPWRLTSWFFLKTFPFFWYWCIIDI